MELRDAVELKLIEVRRPITPATTILPNANPVGRASYSTTVNARHRIVIPKELLKLCSGVSEQFKELSKFASCSRLPVGLE